MADTPFGPLDPSRAPLLSDRQGFDRRWFAANLQEVFAPTRLDEVAAGVGAAIARHGDAVKVASGRHCYENFVYNTTTRAVVDLSALNQAGYDRERQLFFVDAGCENWTAYRSLLNGYGKTLPAGSCYSVGAGGHITGGGYGLLSRLHGLTVDHLQAVDIVLWDSQRGEAQLRHVSMQSADADERDLFWALCGAGGGNFGVIARYYFASLPDAPSHATLWTLAWNWQDMHLPAFHSLLSEYADLMLTLPDHIFTLLKLSHTANGQLGLVVQIASPAGMDWSDHCAINRIATDATAVAQRSSIMKLQYQTYWNNDSAPGESGRSPYSGQEKAHLAWINGMYRDVYAAYGGTPDPARDPDGVVDGCYFNYPDIALGTHADGNINHALWLYFLANYRQRPRNLVAVKRRWDPSNIFHHAQSLPVH